MIKKTPSFLNRILRKIMSPFVWFIHRHIHNLKDETLVKYDIFTNL